MKLALLLFVCLTTAVSSAQNFTGLPVPPPGATVFTQVQQMSGWNSCNAPSCAGGSGNGTYWMAQNQTQPSLSGSSAEIYNSGVWADALWWNKLGAHNSATNLLWDFYVQLDSNAGQGAQSLEYDAFQFLGGYNYMIGSQCNIAAGVWDVWDELNGHWIHTTIACHGFPAGTWHHIQWYVTTNHGTHLSLFDPGGRWRSAQRESDLLRERPELGRQHRSAISTRRERQRPRLHRVVRSGEVHRLVNAAVVSEAARGRPFRCFYSDEL